MDDCLLAYIRAHAAREAPRECCGVVTVEHGERVYRACRNASQGDAEFAIHPEDWAAAQDAGEIVAVVHSHPFASPEPSMADRVECERHGLPWWIVNHPLGHWREIRPEGYRAPLVGRPFCHGVLDCYSLLRDYYREQLGLELPDFERGERWWEKGGDLYRENFEAAGFRAIPSTPDPRPSEHDVILMRVASSVPNHAGVVSQGGLLHHLQYRLSSRDVYGGWYRHRTTHVLRHRTLA